MSTETREDNLWRLRRIDFQKLWKMINSHVNNNAWGTPEFFPVPVMYWSLDQNKIVEGFIVLPIQLHAPKKGGVCRFTVECLGDSEPISLARFLQSKQLDRRAPKIYEDLREALIQAVSRMELIDESSMAYVEHMHAKYTKTFETLPNWRKWDRHQ